MKYSLLEMKNLNSLQHSSYWHKNVISAIKETNAEMIETLLQQRSEHVDSIIRKLWPKPLEEHATVIAVGGYGRKELYPYSDIDLLILHTNKNLSHIYSQIKTFIQELWNYGLEISQSVHTLDSCKQFANENISFMSSILDARVITRRRTKKPNLFELKNIFLLPSRFFKEAKIKEMTSRWIKYGTPYFKQNPHIKNNPGSLRDIQTLYLLEKYSKTAPVIDNSSEIISSARNFLALLRFTLHLYHRRNANQLHKEKQKTIASTLKVSEKTDLLKLYHEKTAPLIRLIRELGLQGIL